MIHALAYLPDRGRSADSRVRFPARAVTQRANELGVSVETTDYINADVIHTREGTDIRRVFVPHGVSMLIFSRPTSSRAADAVTWLRRHRPDIAVCVDVDDEDSDLDVLNPHLRRAVALADVVTCSTPALATSVTYDLRRTFVVESTPPSDMLQQPARALTRKRSHEELNRDRVLGSASGSTRRLARDFAEVSGVLAEIVGADVTDGRTVSYRHIETVGAPHLIVNAVGVVPRLVEVASLPAPAMYRLALSEIDVAVLPVAENDRDTRSALRVLEFAAAGVPVVASLTRETFRLSQAGMPIWLVENTRSQWTRALRALLAYEDDELKSVAQATREYVRRYATTERQADSWATAWRESVRVSRAA